MAPAAHTVKPLDAGRLPWLVRRRLRSVRKKRLTGLIVYGIIRTPSRSMSSKGPTVSVGEDRSRLGLCGPNSRLPKWAPLTPGVHELLFLASRRTSSSHFVKRITLNDGDVLVAICEPVQPWTIYAKSPEIDTWYLGIINQPYETLPVDSRPEPP